ncbi:STAS domain-containing protein [Nocardiopsis lucentensis]|uniref:STAS domain-containing protein n=1 Tax=Nocardiopsis lucentensis TaxID=53441 RepID=UPI000346B0D3|nr:STAS domain-containing protein [Nocardiopsis lucentensis]
MPHLTAHPPAASATPPSVPRLRLHPVPGRGSVLDGGWWPRSGDPVAELPGLVLALDEYRGTVQTLDLGVAGWKRRPGLLEVAGRAIRLSWSPLAPFDLLIAVGSNGAHTRLLVVPPGVDDFVARSAMEVASRATNTDQASEIMATASASLRPPLSPAETDWESEGGILHPAGGHGTGVPRARRRTHRPRGPAPVSMVVRLSGEVDLYTVPRLQKRLLEALRPGTGLVAVDLSAVTFFGAAGIALLVVAQAQADRLGIDLRLAAPGPQTRRVLDITGMHAFLPTHQTLAEALVVGGSLRGSGPEH